MYLFNLLEGETGNQGGNPWFTIILIGFFVLIIVMTIINNKKRKKQAEEEAKMPQTSLRHLDTQTLKSLVVLLIGHTKLSANNCYGVLLIQQYSVISFYL